MHFTAYSTTNFTTRQWHYISGGDGLCAVYIKTNETGQLYFVAKDHLGSIIGLYNTSGTLVEEYSYDAWGRRRDPITWAPLAQTPNYLLTRGYTGHEHLDEFGLINMNGRLYDPLLGRMLSPDNYVQDASGTQNFNRYSYCMNNPLVYTDPSGDYIQYIIGGILGGISGYNIATQKGRTGSDKLEFILKGAVMGLATSGIGTIASQSIGASLGSASWAGAFSFIGSGSIAGGFSTLAFSNLSGNHSYEGLGFLTGAIGSSFQGAVGGSFGAFSGGFGSALIGDIIRDKDIKPENLLLSSLLSGSISFISYQLSALKGWKELNKEIDQTTKFTYKEFRYLLKASQLSTFYNREYNVVSLNSGKIHVKRGTRDGVSHKLYSDMKFSYHLHEDMGYDRFSTSLDRTKRNDLDNYNEAVKVIGPFNNILGTREGHMWFMSDPNDNPCMFDFNFKPYYYPFNLYNF